MGSGTAHNFDEVPVFLGRVTVSLDVTDELAVCLCCCIETEGTLDIFVLKVTVDCLRTSDYLNTCVVCCEILSKNTCVCVGVVTADDNNSCDAVVLANVRYDRELLFCLKFCSAGTDDIETASVSVLIDVLICED